MVAVKTKKAQFLSELGILRLLKLNHLYITTKDFLDLSPWTIYELHAFFNTK
ncbi:hypothetical protein SAMN05878281_3602 [Salegentibacter salegens]|uniref:Uncharacterized protein n=1 Tax=Salegentibacter salegens TaxID=143223 RepID=A0A1M7P0N1_9FLAO|nr:hypothetical protein SAMN05878281_3602 [Salegentibacter salegens]